VEGGITLIVDPDLQEWSELPCDTGSDRIDLQKTFPGVDFSVLSPDWHSKTGPNSTDDRAVEERAKKVRQRLAKIATELGDKEKRDIVVVTHGVFMKFLSGVQTSIYPKLAGNPFLLNTMILALQSLFRHRKLIGDTAGTIEEIPEYQT
jgi:broad specificity phosphatase PhoE